MIGNRFGKGVDFLPFDVEYFEKENGAFPAETFILEQPPKMQAKIFRDLELLEKSGHELREPYSSFLEDGIFELRTIQGNNIARILYFFAVGNKIILTHGFMKKTQKTPRNQIEMAKKYRNEYLKREENKNEQKF